MKKMFYCNDFTLECRRTGSQINGRENECVYDVFYHHKGKTIQMSKSFHTKTAAKKYISETVKLANTLYMKNIIDRCKKFEECRN